MVAFLICISLLIFSLGSYLVWPSRYNVSQHMAVGGAFVTIIVPVAILSIQNKYPPEIVDLYVKILTVGMLTYLFGMLAGFFLTSKIRTQFSFDVMETAAYEQRVTNLTRTLMWMSVIGLIVSYMVMGYIPMFAEDPISAKLFRGAYQAPYRRVAVLYRASFFIMSSIIPIACIIWYRNRNKVFLFLILAGLILMAISLQRSGAFMGVVLAFTIIMSVKGRWQFAVMMVLVTGIFIASSYFYYFVGVRQFTGDQNFWEIITAGTPDVPDHLDFMSFFDNNPVWTYGRTIYGGLIPGHYEWNPAVYTLKMVNPDKEINDIGSGGLRLPLPLWGYVAFQWIGVIMYCLLTGLIYGVAIRISKNLFEIHQSLIIRAVVVIALGALWSVVVNFTQLSMFNIPPVVVSFFYLYRIKWR